MTPLEIILAIGLAGAILDCRRARKEQKFWRDAAHRALKAAEEWKERGDTQVPIID